MDTNVFSPLKEYASSFSHKHKEDTIKLIDSLIDENVNKAENAAQCDLIYKLEKDKEPVSTKLGWVNFLIFLLIVGFFISVGYGIFGGNQELRAIAICIMVPIICIFIVAYQKNKTLNEQIRNFDINIKDNKRKAKAQVEPLMNKIDSRMPIQLIENVMPGIYFDKYLSTKKLNEFTEHYGRFKISYKPTTTTGLQSGTLNTNQFLLLETMHLVMTTKEYRGELTISWQEASYCNGKRVYITRTQTLYAYVTSDYPTYKEKITLIYGNDAAPNLTFKKSPSKINDKSTFFISKRKDKIISDLEDKSRDMKNNSGFTLMSNKEFEAKFNTSDRNNETEIRLMFTPLAQSFMLELLDDNTYGFGDDFLFHKNKKINYIYAEHMNNEHLILDPLLYKHFDYRTIRKTFIERNVNYFRKLYFTFAPILAIPIYQQTKNISETFDPIDEEKSPSWIEIELICNLHYRLFIDNRFSTVPIINTERIWNKDKNTTACNVVAKGFKKEKRLSYVAVRGGDGHVHNVPVYWDEYIPVERCTSIEATTIKEEEITKLKATNQNILIERNTIIKIV